MSTDAYLDARANFERAQHAVQDVAATIRVVGEALLRQPGQMIFSNVQVGLPAEASMSRDSISIDGNEWKTPVQLQQLLANWHQTKDAMEAAWQAVSPERKAGVQPPINPGNIYRR